MAKNDNLKDFLTDVADAIREKKGTTDLINPQDFSAEIASIQSGGGAVAVSAKAVNFRDCDGTILHSYTKDEFLALTELPPLPTREGLICQEWNWDYAHAVECVTECGVLEVGATYITDDGKTRLYITIAAEGRMDVPLYFNQSVANGVTIDWGDGSASETISGTGNVNTTHHYNAIGDYVISLEVADGCTLGLGHGESSISLMGKSAVYSNMLLRAKIGNGVIDINTDAFSSCLSLGIIVIPKGITSIGIYAFNTCSLLQSVVLPQGLKSIANNAFYGCKSLQSVMLPQGITSVGTYAFQNCYSLVSVVIPKSLAIVAGSLFYFCQSLRSVVLPQGITSIGTYAFSNCITLRSVVLPQGITSIGNYAFEKCQSLQSVVLPQGTTRIGNYAYYGCISLRKIEIPQGVTSISNYAFYDCRSLASVVIPKGVKSIYANAFYNCKSMAFYDFSALDSVPSLSSTNAFSSIPSDCKIVVPDALYDTWIAATNWSTYASYIIKKSEWDALNA